MTVAHDQHSDWLREHGALYEYILSHKPDEETFEALDRRFRELERLIANTPPQSLDGIRAQMLLVTGWVEDGEVDDSNPLLAPLRHAYEFIFSARRLMLCNQMMRLS